MRPIRAELDHHRILAQVPDGLLEDIFFERLVNPAIDDQYLAERAVIGGVSHQRDPVAVVQEHVVVLDESRRGNPLDEQVHGIGNDFPEAPEKVSF